MTDLLKEEWRQDRLDGRHVEAVTGDGAFRIAEAFAGPRYADGHVARLDTAQLISAAPDMARALMRIKARLEAQTPGIDAEYSADFGEVCAALKKAGVLT